jgi:hypothetical protein
MRTLLVVWLAALAAGSARAQPGGATLHVRLHSGAAVRLEQARVTVVCGGDSAVWRERQTDGDGRVSFEDLPAATCLVSAESARHLPARDQPLQLAAGSEVTVDLTLSWRGSRKPGPAVGWELLDGLPLDRRTLEVVVRGAVGGEGPCLPYRSDRCRQYRLDGFDVTGADGQAWPVPLGALAQVEIVRMPPMADRAWGGPPIETRALSGSNLLEATALALHGAGETLATATVSGPVVRDRAWYAATLEGDDGGARGLGTLVWQAAARHKLRLLAGQTSPDREGRLLGLIGESLLGDNLVARVQAGWFRGLQASALVEYFADGPLGQHALQVGARAHRAENLEAMVFVEDGWRLSRYLQLTAALAWAGGPLTRHASIGLAWDPTQDGRTVVRASAAPERLAIGIERELRRELAASVDLVQGTLVLGLRQLAGPVRLQLHHERPALLGPGHLSRAAVGWSAGPGLALSALITHAPAGWSTGLRARVELGRWLGFPLVMFTDALDLGGSRGLRLSLRTSI